MFLYILRIHPPSVITDACAFIGQATSPCAMLIIGSVLASAPIREIFSDWHIIPFVFVRLIGIPVIILIISSFLDVDPILKGVVILMSAMPAAANSTMLCTIYGGNRVLSTKLIFISTAPSALTLPIWSYLCVSWFMT